jgi:hypothetical protein
MSRSAKKNQLILVGFGEDDLLDMLAWRDTERQEELLIAPTQRMPRFRHFDRCSEEEILAFVEYVSWASKQLEERNNV